MCRHRTGTARPRRRARCDSRLGRGQPPDLLSVVVACIEAGTALVPLGEATDAEAIALIEQAGAVAVITDRELPLQAEHFRALDSEMRLHRLQDLPCARELPSFGRAEAHVGIDRPAEGGHRGRATSRQRRTSRHRGDGHRPGRHQLRVHSAVALLRARQRRHAAALARHARRASGSRSIPRSSSHDVAESGATVFPGVPFMFERFKSLERDRPLPAALRLLITAGARIDAETVSWFRRQLDRKVHSFYGSSETGGITYDDSDEVERSAARRAAVAGDDRRVRQSERTRRRVASSSAGSAVASGYATRGRRRDVGVQRRRVPHRRPRPSRRLAAALVLTGRVSPLVNVAGRKVDPAEVERPLLDCRASPTRASSAWRATRAGSRSSRFVVRTSIADAARHPPALRRDALDAQDSAAIRLPRPLSARRARQDRPAGAAALASRTRDER